MYFQERKSLEEKNEKFKGREFLQAFVETSPNKLHLYRKKTNNFLTQKTI